MYFAIFTPCGFVQVYGVYLRAGDLLLWGLCETPVMNRSLRDVGLWSRDPLSSIVVVVFFVDFRLTHPSLALAFKSALFPPPEPNFQDAHRHL